MMLASSSVVNDAGNCFPSWIFSKQEVKNETGSRTDGIDYEEELVMRKKACRFLFDLIMNLTDAKGNQHLTGIAALIVHRFYKIHSFRRFDYRDVAAACLLIACKNENIFWRFKYIVKLWWMLKFPNSRRFSTDQQFNDACDLIKYLEEIILMTIAFDLNIELPHQYIIGNYGQFNKNDGFKQVQLSAYKLTSVILMVTDWSVCYSPTHIAAACLNIAAQFKNVETRNVFKADDWYKFQDQTIEQSDIHEMTQEFMEIFRNPSNRLGYLHELNKIHSQIGSQNITLTQKRLGSFMQVSRDHFRNTISATRSKNLGIPENSGNRRKINAGEKHKLDYAEKVQPESKDKTRKC